MARSLRILVLEHEPDDAELLIQELRQSGFAPDWERVETKDQYLAHLRPDLDVILADYALPQFDALEALRLLQERELDVPFIVVTGTMGDEAAVACLRHGADDYLLKDRLARLGPAVERALEARRLRRERREAARDARISARQWQATFDTIRDPVFLLDAGGNIVRCNRATVDFLGRPETEIVGRQCCDLLHGTLKRDERCPYIRALDSLERESMVWRMDDRWFRAVVDPMLDENGYLIGFVHLLEEITQRKEMEDALRRRTRELSLLNQAGRTLNSSLELEEVLGTVLEEVRRLLDVVGCSVWLRDRETGELVCRQITGPGSEVVRGWRLAPGEGIAGWVVDRDEVLIVPDARRDERHFEGVDEETGLSIRSLLSVPLRVEGDVIGALEAVDTEVGRFDHQDLRLLEALAAFAANAIQNARLYEQAETEIRQRRQAEETLRESEGRFRVLVENVVDWVWEVDRNGVYTYVSPQAEEIMGYPVSAIVGRTPFHFMAPDEAERVKAILSEAAAKRERIEGLEDVLLAKDGREVLFETNAAPQFDAQGRFVGYLGTCRDITEQKQIEKEVRRRAEHLRAINELAVELASAPSTMDCFRLIAEKLKAITGALAASASSYDAGERQLVVEYIAAEEGLVSRVSDMLERRIVGLSSPVSDENYARMVNEIIATASDLFETTFGSVPKLVAKTIQRAVGIDRFVGLALADGDDLLGTSVLVFPPGRSAPSDEVLTMFARVTAASLRQRQAEEALHRVNEERRVVLDLVPMGISITDEQGRIINANRMSEELLGISVDEHTERRYDGEAWDIIRPDGTPMPSREYASVRALEDQRVVKNVEMGIVRAKDEVTWISVSAAPIPLEGYGVAIAYTDVTKRKRAEEALRESERRLSQIIEGTSLPGFVIDADHVVTHWNKACEMLTSTPAEEMVGTRRQWRPFYDRERPMLADLVLEGASPAELARYYGHRYRESDLIEGAYEAEDLYPGLGEEGKWLFFSTAPLKDLEGKVVGAVEVFRDITERKRAEEALRRRAADLGLLNEVGSRIAAELDLDGVFGSAASLVQASFGYYQVTIMTVDQERQDLVVRATAGALSERIPDDYRQSLDEGIIGWAARHGEAALVNDVERDSRYIKGHPGEVVTCSELSVPVLVGEDVVAVLDLQSEHCDAFHENDLLVMEAVAQQIAVAMENARLYEGEREAREQLRDLADYLQEVREKERTRIAREVHDEFGQLMTALKLDLAWLSKRLPSDNPRLSRKADEMSDVIKRSFQVVRHVSGELRPGVLDDLGLAAAIEWQAEQFSGRSGISCRLCLDEAAAGLSRQVATALFRILQEALTNVARHAEASEVRIGLHVNPEMVTLMVSDDGRGIAREDVCDAASLGLLGMRERARALDGELTIEGASGQGTTVSARIPRGERGGRNTE